MQPITRRAEADSFDDWAIEGRTVVRHADLQYFSNDLCRDRDGSTAGERCDTVPKGVLDDGLKQKPRDEHLFRFLRHANIDPEAINESDLFDLQISPKQANFVLEGNLECGWFGEHLAQQVADRGEHLPCASRILIDEGSFGYISSTVTRHARW
jgi:hypothetical protein